MEILPGIGIGKIKFGMKQPDIIMMLGEPDDREVIKYGSLDTDEDVTFYYHSLQLQLTFGLDDDYKLGTM